MYCKTNILLLLYLSWVYCDSEISEEAPTCNYTFKHYDDNPEALDCTNRLCIAKCCKKGEFIIVQNHTTKCGTTNESASYDGFVIYKKDIQSEIEATHKKLEDFQLVHSDIFLSEYCATPLDGAYYILEDGSLVLDTPHYYERWNKYNKLSYCVEMVWHSEDKIWEQAHFLMNTYEESDTISSNFTIIAILISCFFMLLVLLVYSVLPQKRNIVGMVLMAYVFTLMTTYVVKVALQLTTPDVDTCKRTIPLMYYAALSSFFWLNIMSFDIWWTFRGTIKFRKIHRDGHLVKFMWYSLYAWGVPALLTIAVTLLDRAELTQSPNIVKPHFDNCFVDIYETFFYLYVPLLILTVINCILFLMTSYDIWITRHKITRFNTKESRNNNRNKDRFVVYLKISVMTGVCWLLEFVLAFTHNPPAWLFILVNSYNLLLGVVIFFLFVFDKKVLIMLCKRFHIENDFVRSLEKQQSANYSKSTETSKMSVRRPDSPVALKTFEEKPESDVI